MCSSFLPAEETTGGARDMGMPSILKTKAPHETVKGSKRPVADALEISGVEFNT